MTNRSLLDTLNSFIPDNSYTIHYKITHPTSDKTFVETFKVCEEEAKKYRQAGYEDISITMPDPTDDFKNSQIYEILQKTKLPGIWLDFRVPSGKRYSMRRNANGYWSDNEEEDNGLMCVFVDHTDLTNSVCTTVSFISH